MEFRIANTFTDSLARLTNDEQKAVKTTAMDLQLNPSNPGMQFHRIDKAKDENFWSIRVNLDIRIIVHKTASSLMLCYADHHDPAYDWAMRRKLDKHPKTGAAQLVTIRETVKEIIVPKYVAVEQPAPPKPMLFADRPDDALLAYGVPPEWLDDVKQADEDSLLDLIDHLPEEASEALLSLATGTIPEQPKPISETVDPFEHPDAQRRFRVLHNVEELQQALDYPWDKWMVFLHPAQRELVERDYNGPARVSGSAGTGKTIVALHRAVYLARTNPTARVLLTTFSLTLANALRERLKRLISSEPRLADRIDVYAINDIGKRLYQLHVGPLNLVSRPHFSELLETAHQQVPDHDFSNQFLLNEWEQVVDAWGLESWEAYRDVLRLGRKTRLPERRRAQFWAIFEKVRHTLQEEELSTISMMFTVLAQKLATLPNPLFDFIIVDEAQDLGVAQLRFLAALGGKRSNALFFAGDLGQRIFQQPFSWKALGVEIQGRSQTLKINYRTSHQIREQADLLLGPEIADVDGNVDDRRGTISVFNGPQPMIMTFDSVEDEIEFVAEWLKEQIQKGVAVNEIGLFVRSEPELARSKAAVEKAGLSAIVLDENMERISGCISISTMHLAKGLEFRSVAVMGCDDEVIPSQTRIDAISDEADLDEVYHTERHLLYVACTRARDQLMITGVNPASEFLEDLLTKPIQ